MSLKIAFYFLLALSCGLALAKEEPEAVVYKLASDGADEQEVFVAADFFNDPRSVKEEVSDQADDDEEAPAKDSDKRKVASSNLAIEWNTAEIYPVASSAARTDTAPSSIPAYPLLPAIPNYNQPSFPHYPPPFVQPYPYYPYPYYGIPFPAPPPPPPPPSPQQYPYPGQVYSHSHSTSTPAPTTSRPSQEKRKHCKEIFPIGKICKVDFE